MIADSPLIGKIILILVLIAIDAFCSCAEIAVISLDASELEKMADLALQLCNIMTCCQCFYAEPFRIGTHHIQRLRSDRSG